MAKLKLVGPRLVIAPLPPVKASEQADIVYVDKYYDDQKRWRVIDVGPGHRQKDGSYKPLEVRPGDKILVGVTGEILHEFTDKVRIINSSEVVAVWH